jgi:Spy/CpxP family protein refolding chaperone
MQQSHTTIWSLGLAAALSLTLGLSGAWADPASSGHGAAGDGKDGAGMERHGGGYGMGGEMMGMMKMMGGMHGGTGHFLRHLRKHQKDIGLSDEQIAKVKELELNLDKTRIRAEADILIAEREHAALVEDEKSDLAAIEAKLKQSADLQIGLRMAVIKTKREALALLTPEQRDKEKAAHEKMMEQHRSMRSGHGSPHGTGPHKAAPKKDEGKKE